LTSRPYWQKLQVKLFNSENSKDRKKATGKKLKNFKEKIKMIKTIIQSTNLELKKSLITLIQTKLWFPR
jgi:hypothetical protein